MLDSLIKHILIVDDDNDYRIMVQHFLQQAGYICDSAVDAFSALDKVQQKPFDLVITDIIMPGMDGLEFSRKVKAAYPHLEVIMMTGHASKYSYSDIIAAGAADFIAKPFEMAKLQAKLRRLEREKAILRQLQEMNAELTKAHDELEIRVEERTAELSRVNKLLQTVFAVIPDLIVLKDRELKVLAVNQAFCRFLHKPEEEILGKTDNDFFPADEAEAYRQADALVMKGGMHQITDEHISGASGKTWFQVVRTPVLDETGTSTGILYSCRDISVRKQAEESLKLHKARLQDLSKQLVDDQPGLLPEDEA